MSTAPVTPTTLTEWAQGAKIFSGLGSAHRKISTRSREAQQYFDQGIRFMWAFNHDEAPRSFARGALLDAHCAMCLWGFALTVGPNYNMPMMAEPRARAAYAALQKAMQLEKSVTPVERDLIEALRARYPKPIALDPSNGAICASNFTRTSKKMRKWTQDDFDLMSWHDNHVHGLRFSEGEHGTGELEFDLDYILEWLTPAADSVSYRYRIAPARLRFRDVTNLAISIDYASASAAMGPFSIDGIERHVEQRGYSAVICWRIPVNFPPGEIRFEASGFEQSLVADVLLIDRQWLTPTERGAH